ncbi:MAG: IS1595 family transposase, partial [Treponema sp.]|nr:IS1595 family transposase [Treponema sp.]
EEAAIDYFIKIRYGGVLTCPFCKATTRVYRYKKRPKVCHCKNCNSNFSVFKDTIFEKTTTDIRKWFQAIRLFLNARKGFSAKNLQRELGIAYETAWRMFHQVRLAMQNRELKPFEGLVEMDETFIGGKPRKYPPKLYDPATYSESKKLTTGLGTTKTIVAGIKERKSGRVRTQIMPPNEFGERVTGSQLKEVIDKTCVPGSTIVTDEFPAYGILDKPVSSKVDLSLLDGSEPTGAVPRYGHHTVCHKRYEWVAGLTEDGELIHTNGIESHWAILKRSHYGIYHSISDKYLPRYLGEYSFRQNTRTMPPLDVFDLLLKQSIIKSSRK